VVTHAFERALTDAGAELFERLRAVAARHDERLRSTPSDRPLAELSEKLEAAADPDRARSPAAER
jgi:DNA-binding MarR family transcriptional regulator